MRGTLRRHAFAWLRRATLLGAVAVSLALVGDQASARAPFASNPKPDVIMDTRDAGLSFALHSLGAVHQSLGALSDGALESVSLLALGIGLIGAGQALGQKRRRRHAASGHVAEGTAGTALRPGESGLRSFARKAAR